MKPTIFSILLIIMVTIVSLTNAYAEDTVDRSQRPGPSKTPRVQLPKIQKTKLGNGLEIWLVEKHELPIVAMNLVIQAGSDHDPLDRPGVASMTARSKHGTSRIVPFLPEGSSVDVPAQLSHYVCTEYGIVNLRGLNGYERAAAMISIAHPDDREWLEKEARKSGLLAPRLAADGWFIAEISAWFLTVSLITMGIIGVSLTAVSNPSVLYSRSILRVFLQSRALNSGSSSITSRAVLTEATRVGGRLALKIIERARCLIQLITSDEPATKPPIAARDLL